MLIDDFGDSCKRFPRNAPTRLQFDDHLVIHEQIRDVFLCQHAVFVGNLQFLLAVKRDTSEL